MHFELLDELVIIFLLSIVVNLVCNKIKLTATVGFLLTGVLCGPSLLGIVDSQSISDVAELGVAMLLFTIGMELSGEALSRLKRPVFLGGSLQIGLTVLAIAGLTALLDGTSLPNGIFWGCLVALSSSAIVLQIFQQKGITSTPTGRLSLAILVFQDIMVAPMMLCVPLLSGQFHMAPLDMLLSVLKVGGILGAVLLAAHLGLNRFMEAVMRTRSRELLFLSTLGTCFGMALLTHSLGLSLSLGAFLAGLMLARSQYSMSVISGIMPYRDVFMSLFFISVGMMLDLSFFLQHIWAILFNTLLFILIKSLLTMPAVLVQGYPLRTAIQTSLCLAQVGEFSFVLAASGLAAGLLNDIGYQSFLALSVITMMLTPFLINLAPRAAALLTRGRGKEASSPEAEQQKTSTLKDHLIIVGFGISGKHLAQVAKESGIPYTILEMNPETVSRYKNKEPISHGDASQPVILEHLGVYTARVLAIIISDPAAVRAITLEARRMNPDLYIVARTRFITEVAPLRRLGANVVIAEEFETSIEVSGAPSGYRRLLRPSAPAELPHDPAHEQCCGQSGKRCQPSARNGSADHAAGGRLPPVRPQPCPEQPAPGIRRDRGGRGPQRTGGSGLPACRLRHGSRGSALPVRQNGQALCRQAGHLCRSCDTCNSDRPGGPPGLISRQGASFHQAGAQACTCPCQPV